jgi:hypothetical protein
MTETAGQAPNHWPLLDFLRATAALLVLFGHTRDSYFVDADVLAQPGLFLKLFYSLTALQYEAVVIFFVLSGFLIGGSLFDSMQRGSFDLVRYLIARFVRIYIVYIPALVVTEAVFLIGSLLLSDPGAGLFRPLFSQQQMCFGGASQAICHLAGLQGFSCPPWSQNFALWTLGYEWVPYLFAPPIIQLIVSKASPGLRLMAIALVCAIAATVCEYPKEGEVLVHRLVPRRRLLPRSACRARPAPGGTFGRWLDHRRDGNIVAHDRNPAGGRYDHCGRHRHRDRLPSNDRISPCAASLRLGGRVFLHALRHPHPACIPRRRHISKHRISNRPRSAESTALYGIWGHKRDVSFGCLPRLARFRAKNRASPCRHDETGEHPIETSQLGGDDP